MLALTRNIGQSILIGTDTQIRVMGISGGEASFKIQTPRPVTMYTNSLAFWIGDDIFVEIVSVSSGKVKIGIKAPKDVYILRSELIDLPDARHPDSVAPSRRDGRHGDDGKAAYRGRR